MIGQTLGPYRVIEKLGEGGMGEVYKARDTRLDRSVAIKVLPAHVSADPERRARFEREARTIAGLTHPHICTLHDVGEHEGSTFLVMEHLTGETLAARLQKGPLPLEQALTVATEIADALAAAHRQGVIHRDLKPGNVMLTKAGAKLLDFGLAKLKGYGEQPTAAHLASAATQSTPLTAEGMIVGTLQYMAPEQLEGKPADARTDLWALGAILYEMLTGARAFEGGSPASLIGAILERDPTPLASRQPLTPPGLDRLVRRCLAKDPDQRWDSAHDVADELRWLASTAAPSGKAVPSPRRSARVPALLAMGVAGALAGAGVTWLFRPSLPKALPSHLTIPVTPADELNAGGVLEPFTEMRGGALTSLTWTPDGRGLVFVGRRSAVQQLYVRQLDAVEAVAVKGTEGAQVPAVSADGRWVGFWASGAIRKVPVNGGPVMDLAGGMAYPPRGLAWDEGGAVYFGVEIGPISKISPEGAVQAVTTTGQAEVSHGFPCPLPGGRALLYTVRKREWSWGDEEVVAHTFSTGTSKVLLRDAADARYVDTGHLLFLRRGTLFAVPFDPERLELVGREVPVVDAVAQALVSTANSFDTTGAGQYAVASTGALAWVPSPVVPPAQGELVLVDRRGQITPLGAPLRSYGAGPRLSPDGRRLAVPIIGLTEVGLWVFDLARGTLTPLNQDGESEWPLWTPDGRHLVFAWLKDGRHSIAIQPADGTAPPVILLPGGALPSSLTSDGRHLAGVVQPDNNIIVANIGGEKPAVESLVQTRQTEYWPEFSPDGRWLAYGSDASGRLEVYVRPYPGPGPAEQVSLEGGRAPAWHPNGRELFFVGLVGATDKRRMMAADFTPGSPPQIGRPRLLFEFVPGNPQLGCEPIRCYNVAPDGDHFYALRWPEAPAPPPVTHVNLVENWFEELKAKVPVGK